MSDPEAGAGGVTAAAGLDRWVAQARAKAERYQAMQAQVGQVSVTESSRDGMVTVTVDSAGNVTGLSITDKVRDCSGVQVSSAVLSTLRRAQSRLPDKLAEVMAATIGDDQATMDTIVGNYRSKFPEPEPDEPETAPDGVQRIGALDEAPPAAPPTAPSSPKRRPATDSTDSPDRPDSTEDDGFDGQSFMVRK
jgi:DNA-binding protein YbaB